MGPIKVAAVNIGYYLCRAALTSSSSSVVRRVGPDRVLHSTDDYRAYSVLMLFLCRSRVN